MDFTWFELVDYRKRRLKDAVWIPLRQSEYLQEEGRYGYAGYRKEFLGSGSIAIPLAHREQASELGWSEIGLIHGQGVYASKEGYKPADTYQLESGKDFGTELVLVQQFDSDDPSEWHLHQDLVFALGLKREGDEWVRSSEDYVTVARLRRDPEGQPVAFEIKNEFLRDYLSARGMFLKVASYRQRLATVDLPLGTKLPETATETSPSQRFERRVWKVTEGGRTGSFAVFNVWRTDISDDEDVPVAGPETNDNTAYKSHRGEYRGPELTNIEGEVWREEDIEPAPTSPRVRNDQVPTGISYIVDASGARMTSEELDDEDIGRWLWFRPEVVPAIQSHRGGTMRWYTLETGGVGFREATLVHFGINSVDLVTVYAYDVARRPVWQQRIWAGYNVSPEGRVSAELLSAQMRTIVADTLAPEKVLPEILDALDEAFRERIGSPLFRSHNATDNLLSSISRFRALADQGLLGLAKDLMRLIADRVDHVALQAVVPPPKGVTWRSLKSLEGFLVILVENETARQLVGPLVGAYDLRMADAHLPKSEIREAYSLARVDIDAPPLTQGLQLIASVVQALIDIRNVVTPENPKEASFKTDVER